MCEKNSFVAENETFTLCIIDIKLSKANFYLIFIQRGLRIKMLLGAPTMLIRFSVIRNTFDITNSQTHHSSLCASSAVVGDRGR